MSHCIVQSVIHGLGITKINNEFSFSRQLYKMVCVQQLDRRTLTNPLSSSKTASKYEMTNLMAGKS